MRKINLKVDFIWVIFAQLIAIFSGFLGLKILTNLLSSSQFGIYQLGWSVALIMATALFNPIGHAIIRLNPNHVENETQRLFFSKITSYLYQLVLVVTVVGLLLSFLVVQYSSWNLFFCVASLVAVIGHGLSLIFQHYQTAMRQRASFALSQFFVSFGRPFAAAGVILLFTNDENLSSAALLGSGLFLFLFVFVQVFFVKKGIGKIESEVAERKKEEVKPVAVASQPDDTDLFTVAGPMILLGILTVVSLFSDRWLIASYLDLAAVGVYTAVYQITSAPLNFFQGAANRFALPLIFEQAVSSNSDEIRKAAQRNAIRLVICWCGLIGLAVLVSFLAHNLIVRILTTAEIAQYSILLPILFLGMALERTAQIMTIKGNTNMQIVRYLPARFIHILVLIPTGIWLTIQYGIFGFAWAHIIAGVAVLLATLWVNFFHIKKTI